MGEEEKKVSGEGEQKEEGTVSLSTSQYDALLDRLAELEGSTKEGIVNIDTLAEEGLIKDEK